MSHILDELRLLDAAPVNDSASRIQARGADKQKRAVFFLVNTSTIFEELFRVAKLLMRFGVDPMFRFTFEHWTAERDVQRC